MESQDLGADQRRSYVKLFLKQEGINAHKSWHDFCPGVLGYSFQT